MKKNQIIRITGQLGGTLFRQEARQKGEKLGLMGHAQIEPNGDLRIDAEGESDAPDAFVTWCKTGPDGTKRTRHRWGNAGFRPLHGNAVKRKPVSD